MDALANPQVKQNSDSLNMTDVNQAVPQLPGPSSRLDIGRILDQSAQAQLDAFKLDHGPQLNRLETISKNFNVANEFAPTTFPFQVSPPHS